MEVGVSDVGCEIVANSEGEAEAVEPLSGEFGQVSMPERSIVEPNFVFNIAVKWAGDAADFVGGFLDDGLDALQIGEWVGREPNRSEERRVGKEWRSRWA